MKSVSKQCPNCKKAMKRLFYKSMGEWRRVNWQRCPICKMILPD